MFSVQNFRYLFHQILIIGEKFVICNSSSRLKFIIESSEFQFATFSFTPQLLSLCLFLSLSLFLSDNWCHPIPPFLPSATQQWKQKTIQASPLWRHPAANLPSRPEIPRSWSIPKWRESVVAPSARLSGRREMGEKGCLPQSFPPFVPMQARSGDPRQGGAVSVGPIWHACIAIRPTKHRSPRPRGISVLRQNGMNQIWHTACWWDWPPCNRPQFQEISQRIFYERKRKVTRICQNSLFWTFYLCQFLTYKFD